MTQSKIVLVLFLMVLLASLSVPAFSQQEVPVAFNYMGEWLHVSVDQNGLESIHLEKIGADYQVYFHPYNSSETVYDQFIIFGNEPFTDPLRQFEVVWDGAVTATSQVVFSLSSSEGIVSVVVSKFVAEQGPIEGYPPMKNVKHVVTEPDKVYDVLLDDERFCSFDWSWTTISVNTEDNSTGSNQTLPQIRLYSLEGTVVDTRLITSPLKPLSEYGGVNGVGWMMDTMTASYVKWIIYSGLPITVRPNSGWGSPQLNYFNLYPTKVRPKQLVTLSFILPEGVSNYETNLDEPFLAKYLADEIEETYDLATRQYVLTFSFSDKARGNQFMVSVYADKQGVPYQSSETIQVLPAWIETFFWTAIAPAVGVLVFVVFLLLAFRWLLGRRRAMPPSGTVLGRI